MSAAPAADTQRRDLVIQAPGLPPEAVHAFVHEIAHLRLQRQPASVRLVGVQDPPGLAAHVARLAAHWRCDATLVPPALRLSDFRVLAFDMDSTLIQIECIDQLADLAGLGPQVAAITEAAMQGQIADYSDSLRRRVALLAGTDVALLERIACDRMRLTPGAERLIAAARAAGLSTLLVTGGFEYFARLLQQRLQIDFVEANQVRIVGGCLAAEVNGPDWAGGRIIDARGKAQALERACERSGCSPDQAIALGDGANDLQMLGLAGMGVAFHAKPRVREACAYALNYSGLDGVLEWMRAE